MNTTFIKTRFRHFSLVKKLLCAGALLVGSSGQEAGAQTWVKIGTGTTSNTVGTYPTPFGNRNAGQRAQYLYRAAELTAAGVKPGWIDAMGFFVTNTNSAVGHTSLKFFVGGTTTNTLPTAFITDGPLRFYDKVLAYLPVDGWNDFNYSTPYYWNGTDNILVGTCFWSGSDFNNASVEWTTGLAPGSSQTFVAPKSSGAGIAVCTAPNASPAPTNQPTARPNIRFRVKSDTCNSKPIAGTAISDVPDFCILDVDSIQLSLVGNTLAFRVSFRWQSTTDTTGPWTFIGPADSTNTSKKVKQTTGTYYRCIVTCNATGQSDTSKKVYVPMAPPYNCDCASEAISAAEEKILSVKLAAMTNLTPCSVISLGYNDFTSGSKALPPVDLEPGTNYTLETRLGTCGSTDNSRAVKVFIDFDQSATYEVSEMVYANVYSAAQPNPQNAVGDFVVPLTAKKGKTTMRIIYGQATALADIKPCGKYPVGETQDYPINILQFGKPTVTGRLKVCEHDSVVMNAASVADTPVVFTWTGPGGFTGIGPKITFVDADPSLTGTYYVTATSKGRTSTPQAVEVVVYPKPPIPNVLNANMCQYETDGTLKTDGKNVLWYNVPVGGFGDTAAPKLPTHTPNTATFYLTQTVNGCVSDRGKVVINVLLKPAPPVVKTPVTYCQLQVPDLAAKGENLKWYLDSAGGVASTISPVPPTGFPDSVDYYVSQTVNGCESDRARVRVIVYEQPNGLILHSKQYVCQYDTASFFYFGSAPASYDYKWFSTDGVFESGGGQGPVVYRFNKAGDNVVNLFVNNGKCATFKISDTITTRPAPTADIDTVRNACIDVPITITIDSTTPNLEYYSWNWDNGVLSSETVNGGPYNVVYNTPGWKTLHLTVYHRTCPSLDITQDFYVHDRPFARILSVSKVTNYGRDTASISGAKICGRDTLVFKAYYDSTYTYKWSPERFFDRDTIAVVGDRISTPAFIRVDVTSEFGCKSADSIYINAEPCCEMAFPNAFTPNGDSKNDIFRPIRDGRQDIITFRIVNRWGQVVFESASTDGNGWDGTFAGKIQEMGVYQYFIKYRCLDGGIYEKKGDVTLIR